MLGYAPAERESNERPSENAAEDQGADRDRAHERSFLIYSFIRRASTGTRDGAGRSVTAGHDAGRILQQNRIVRLHTKWQASRCLAASAKSSTTRPAQRAPWITGPSAWCPRVRDPTATTPSGEKRNPI